MDLSRRHFIQGAAATAGAVILDAAAKAEGNPTMPNPEGAAGAIVICNHWTQFGIGETFPEGEIRGRWYRRNFSTVFGFERIFVLVAYFVDGRHVHFVKRSQHGGFVFGSHQTFGYFAAQHG